MALTQDTILSFLSEHGGKVKNSELLNKFKGVINSSDPAEKKRNRDLFKHLINSVAVVKEIDDVKYVVVKKKYQGFVKVEKISLGLKSPLPSSPSIRSSSKRDSRDKQNVDIINNNYYPSSIQSGPDGRNSSSLKSDHSAKCDAEFLHSGCSSDCNESLTTTVLSVSSDTRFRKTGSVFALVAIKSPNAQREQLDKREKTNHKATEDSFQQPQLSLEIPPHPITAERSMKVKATVYQNYIDGENYLYRSPRTKRKELEAPGSPPLRRCNKVTRPGNETKDSDVIPLGPTEHEWLVKSATGCWRQIYGLMRQDTQLAIKRNFISGFTILHWAAKSGNSEMVRKVIDVSRQSGSEIDVNTKSHDGYTPLHIAAIHSHECVLSLLVCQYSANINMRDNSGKKPYHYLCQDVSMDIRKMLGDPQVLQGNTGCYLEDDQSLPDFPKGFNTLSKLFQPHKMGHKKKYKRRSSFLFISDDHEDIRKNIALNSKLFQ